MVDFQFNIFNFIILGSVFVGLTFSLLLLCTPRINKKANIYLGLLSLIIVCWNSWVLSLDFSIFNYFPKFYCIPLNFSLALGPLIYLYTQQMTHVEKKFKRRELWHFLPLVIELSVHVLIVVQALNLGVLATDTPLFFTLIPWVQFAAICSILYYAFRSLKKIKAYHRWLKLNYSNDGEYSLNWLYRLIIIFAVLWFLWVPYTLVDYYRYDFQLGIADYYPLYILLSLISIWISAEAFLKPEVIFLESSRKELPKNEEKSNEISSKASWLNQQMKANLFYLDARLSLQSLASELDLHPNYLSKIINSGLDKNFADFVNEFRVHAVIEKLNDPAYAHITLLGISFESGFNSKSTFNRVFKQITGKTPMDYKKSMPN